MPTHPLEVLRFNFKPRALRLLLAARADPGPASHLVWSQRSGVSGRHLAETIRELKDMGAIGAQASAEGLKLLVQPVEFWRERPLCRRDVWSVAWADAARQSRLDLVTEEPGITDALADAARALADVSAKNSAADVAGESVVNKSVPESGSPRIGEQKVPESGTASTTRAHDVRRNVSIRDAGRLRVGEQCEQPERISGLREGVRGFVGERDWNRYWGRRPWSAIFEDERAVLLEGALRYLLAGIADGVRMRCAGAALWDQFQREVKDPLWAETAPRRSVQRIVMRPDVANAERLLAEEPQKLESGSAGKSYARPEAPGAERRFHSLNCSDARPHNARAEPTTGPR